MAGLTAEQVRAVATKPGGRQELAEYMGWAGLDEQDSLQQSIQLDFLYDSLLFCTHKGFPWPQCCRLLNLAQDMLEVCKGKPLIEAVQIYASLCKECQSSVDEPHLTAYTSYIFDTFLRHYNLYQLVLTGDQEKKTLHYDLTVETAPEPLPFSQCKDIKIWEYEQAIENIDKLGEESKKQRELQQVEQRLSADQQLQGCYQKLEETEQPVEREQLSTLISEVASAHMNSVMLGLRHDIDSTMSDLAVMLEKTSFPRPPELVQQALSPVDSVPESELLDEFPAELGGFGKMGNNRNQRAGTRASTRIGSRSSSRVGSQTRPESKVSRSSQGPPRAGPSRAGPSRKGSFGVSQATSRSVSRATKTEASASSNKSDGRGQSSPGKLRVKTAQVTDKSAANKDKAARASSRGSRVGSNRTK